MTSQELQRWRRRRHMTQHQAAELIGVTRNSVNRWEMGLHPISRRTARMIEMLEAAMPAARRHSGTPKKRHPAPQRVLPQKEY